ncbi:AraC family transcriptional regulator [Salmonella enterica subsp. enterica]|nr:AraC family transcriptional regulator [Salmonella enterica subsp. enterica]
MSQTAYCLNLIKVVCELKTNLGSSSNNLRRVYFYWKKIKQSRLVWSEIEGHIDFSSLEVSYDLMQKFYKVFDSTRKL